MGTSANYGIFQPGVRNAPAGGPADPLPGRFSRSGLAVRSANKELTVPVLRLSFPDRRELMNLQPWNLVFFAGFVLYAGIRGVYEKRTRRNENALSRVDSRDRVLLAVVLTGSLLLPALYLCTPWLAFADYRLPPVAPWCGVVIMAAGIWLFWRSHADLGLNWSITLEIRKGHELITRGVYRSIRHPMYASIFLFSIGQGLMLENWLAGWAALVTFTALYLVRTPREERMMEEFFGRQYRDYMDRTGRIIPRWSDSRKNA